ncbi:hypothetical protein HHL22_15615 [Hymenobacter sp. RP-2-7]|uniref:DUF3108 domain-containing protein n=1 Tax=Hymenobacter polaris TaxID=2682546 RepID=A0A7Y0AFY7_9BACT|nr:hypothetical protein [Hymenobacter polaris]NML66634.1 hypothetical protein [Hymenobacter polaris]
MLPHYFRPRAAHLWLAAGLLGACQAPPHEWLPGKTFKTRGHRLTYRVEHFGVVATRPFLVDTIAITTYGTLSHFPFFEAGDDSLSHWFRQWKTSYSYGANAEPVAFPGVIENDSTLWLHPPRDGRYRILELSPFPYIKLPARQGQRWPWHLAVGSQWADPKWAVWRGEIHVTYAYQTLGQQLLATPLGPLTCWLVRAQASCPVGTSSLDSYYHPQLGFVRLAYRTLDGRRLTLSLVDTARVFLPAASPATYLPKTWQLPGQ